MGIKSLLVVATLAVSLPFSYAESKIELLPEVKQILNAELDESTLNQNGYVALLAINAPESIDYKEIGKKLVIDNVKMFEELNKKQQNDIFTTEYNKANNYYQGMPLTVSYAGIKSIRCSLAKDNCIKQIIEQQPQLQQSIKNNHILLTRYAEIVNLPHYTNIPLFVDIQPSSYFATLIDLMDFRLSEAVLLINKGSIAEGLTILQQELNFAKRILTSKVSLADQMIAMNHLFRTYHIISDLLDTPQLARQLNNPNLLNLLKPFTKQQQQALGNALTFERDRGIIWAATFDKESIIKELNESASPEEQYSLSIYDRNAVLNAYYKKFQAIINAGKLTLPEASQYYLAHIQTIPVKTKKTKEQILQEYGKDNFWGGVIVEELMPEYIHFFRRFYDVISYSKLVETKLKIKQANISKEQVPTFLAELGDQAKNPYNQKPFRWDADKQLLSSEWLDTRKGTALDGERASVYIKFDH